MDWRIFLICAVAGLSVLLISSALFLLHRQIKKASKSLKKTQGPEGAESGKNDTIANKNQVVVARSGTKNTPRPTEPPIKPRKNSISDAIGPKKVENVDPVNFIQDKSKSKEFTTISTTTTIEKQTTCEEENSIESTQLSERSCPVLSEELKSVLYQDQQKIRSSSAAPKPAMTTEPNKNRRCILGDVKEVEIEESTRVAGKILMKVPTAAPTQTTDPNQTASIQTTLNS